jgi:hypothetical protein
MLWTVQGGEIDCAVKDLPRGANDLPHAIPAFNDVTVMNECKIANALIEGHPCGKFLRSGRITAHTSLTIFGAKTGRGRSAHKPGATIF